MAKQEDKQQQEVRMTSVRTCTCTSPGQDRLYGTGRRVHNRTKQTSPPRERRWRCSGCGTVRD